MVDSGAWLVARTVPWRFRNSQTASAAPAKRAAAARSQVRDVGVEQSVAEAPSTCPAPSHVLRLEPTLSKRLPRPQTT